MLCKYASKVTKINFRIKNIEKRNFFSTANFGQLRLELLQLICNPTLETPNVRDIFDKYISLLSGFITPPDGGSDASKLRYNNKILLERFINKN